MRIEIRQAERESDFRRLYDLFALARRRFSSADPHNQPIAELDEADGLIYKRPKNDRVRAVCVSSHLLVNLDPIALCRLLRGLPLRPAYHDEDLLFAKADGTPISSWLFGFAFRTS